MRILSLNIRHGGGSRIGPIHDYIQRQNADVLVVSEFRNGRTGAQLRDDLRSSGFEHQQSLDCEPRTNSVLLAAKTSISPLAVSPATEDSHRILGGTVSGIDFYGVYFANQEKKQPLFEYILSETPRWLSRASVLTGDFNTGLWLLDEPGKIFKCTQEFSELYSLGWTDAWRKDRAPDAFEPTWVSNRDNGFRLDHAFISPPLTQRFLHCDYDHSTRHEGLSDHSAVILELEAAHKR